MPTYVVLASFTDKGAHDIKDTIGRSDKFKDMAKKARITVKDMYWTLGPTDVVAICEAPDDETATALSMSVSARGHVRTQTMRAFTADEISKILDRLV
ncbi:GYD domain-containing protein [Hyphomicrobium sp.]|uniref:GYD domain-containing protein n=1 Tax=Hyphomicrobium sp. TaxID=82 RepID=UPI002E365C82|nr:GYD domain-containing protein [Hyphomicrobium sp.]HEX2842623.1 GYD domain-containing protein [Hyphomicrobium sp.]